MTRATVRAMLRRVPLLSFALATLAVPRPSTAGAVPATDVPLAHVRVLLRDGITRRVVVHGRWSAPTTAALRPAQDGAVLRIAGGPDEGDSGPIRLVADGWRRAAATWRYVDPRGRAGGIRRVVLRQGARGGTLAIRGQSPNWGYSLARPQTRVAIVLATGGARICAEVGGADLVQRVGRETRGTSGVPPATCPCAVTFGGTWEAIQQIVFADHTCTQALCHGAAPGSGGLDLRPPVAYRSLVGTPSTYDAALVRVVPGASATSLLWLKLAARTLKLEGVPLSPMPIGDPPLSRAELEAVERWIAAGAPESGAVAKTAALLDVSLTP